MTTAHANRKRFLFVVLAVLAVLGLGVAAAAWRIWGAESVAWFHASVGWVRSLGAGPYFVAMAVLPSCGVPISVFNLSAGPLFGPVIGLPWVLVLAGACLAVNITLSYVGARWLVRPWAARLCKWLGYTLPEVQGESGVNLVMVVRFTPGPPYILQNLLLGMAGVPFWPYFFISWIATYAYAFALIMFGDALVQGRGGAAMAGVSLLIALTVIVRIVRKKVGKRGVRRLDEARADDMPPPTP